LGKVVVKQFLGFEIEISGGFDVYRSQVLRDHFLHRLFIFFFENIAIRFIRRAGKAVDDLRVRRRVIFILDDKFSGRR
jgi:hypothetical protein